MIQTYCNYCDERHNPENECEDYDPFYAVETRNMHTAIHELFTFKTRESAQTANNIVSQIETEIDEFEIFDLWEQLNKMDYEHFEVNYRFKDSKDRYKLIDGRIVEVVNDNCYNIY